MTRTRIYFATDLHGSSLCFRKFVNAATVYGADVMILGGDVAGKAIQQIVHQPRDRWLASFNGAEYLVDDGPELARLEQQIADHGYYPCRAEPGELEALRDAGTLDDLFLRLMRERLAEWLQHADERLRPHGTPVYFMLGNDDPPELADMLDEAPWGTHCEGKVIWIDDQHEMISWGYSNTTPWHSYREQDEDALGSSVSALADRLTKPERAIFNLHVPPYGTRLDDAPKLNGNLVVQGTVGQVQFAAAGSTAVRRLEEERQPLLGLHGHIHESAGIRTLGRTMILNPGSDYSSGALNGALITLDNEKVKGHQLVRG